MRNSRTLSSLKRRRLQSLAKRHGVRANDKSVNLVLKLSKLFDSVMDSNDESTEKENMAKVQDPSKEARNGKEGKGEEETKRGEERKAFGDMTSLLRQWENISINGRKDKLDELSQLSPQKHLKRQLYEKRQQMLRMRIKVQSMYEGIMAVVQEKEERTPAKEKQQKYEEYMRCRKELVDISAQFEALQEEYILMICLHIVTRDSQPATLSHQSARDCANALSFPSFKNNPHEEKTDPTYFAKTTLADCDPLSSICIVSKQQDVNITVQQGHVLRESERSATEGNEDMEANASEKGLITPKKSRANSPMIPCSHNGDENKENMEDLVGPSHFGLNPDRIATMEEKETCNVDKDHSMNEIDHATHATASAQANDPQTHVNAQPLSSLSLVVPHMLSTEHSTAFQDDFIIAEKCDIGTASPGLIDDFAKGDTFDTTNAVGSESAVTHNYDVPEEQTSAAADIIVDQPPQSANKDTMKHDNELTAPLSSGGTKDNQTSSFKKLPCSDGSQGKRVMHTATKDTIKKPSSPLSSQFIKKKISSSDKLSSDKLKLFDKDWTTPTVSHNLSLGRRSNSSRWSNKSSTSLERVDTPIIQKSHKKYFRPSLCNTSLPSIGEDGAAVPNSLSPVAKCKQDSNVKNSLPTPQAEKKFVLESKKIDYSHVKSKTDSGLRKLPGTKPSKPQETQSPVSTNNRTQSRLSSTKRPIKRTLGSIVDKERTNSVDERKRRRVEEQKKSD